jgi:enoyl-CoA hydratase/carnithine racemase
LIFLPLLPQDILVERAFDAFLTQKKTSAEAARQAGVELETQSDSEEEEEEVQRLIGGGAIKSGGVGVESSIPSQMDVDSLLMERKRRQLLDKMNLL